MKSGTAKKPYRRKVSSLSRIASRQLPRKNRFTLNQLPPVTTHTSASLSEPMISIWSGDPPPAMPLMIGSMLKGKSSVWDVTRKGTVLISSG